MSRKEVRRRQPSGSFFMPSPIPPEGLPSHPVLDAGSREYPLLSFRTFGKYILHLFIITFFSLPNRLRCGHPVIPHFDAGFRNTRLGQPNLFIISFFSLPNRPRCGHPVNPHFDAGSRNTRLGHSALDAESRNTGRSTCKIHSLYVPFSGPRIFPQKKRGSQKKAPG